MRFHEIPERLLGSSTAVRVLRVLVRFPQREMTGRELAREAGAPHPRALERLNEFEDEGLVSRRFAGRAHLWRLERDHALVAPLTALFQVDDRVRQELRSTLERGIGRIPGVTEARLFGSVARGDEDPDSDIDIFLLVKDRASKDAARREMEGLRGEVRSRFGNWVSPIILTEAELRRRPRRAWLGPAREEGLLLGGARPHGAGSRRGQTRGA